MGYELVQRARYPELLEAILGACLVVFDLALAVIVGVALPSAAVAPADGAWHDVDLRLRSCELIDERPKERILPQPCKAAVYVRVHSSELKATLSVMLAVDSGSVLSDNPMVRETVRFIAKPAGVECRVDTIGARTPNLGSERIVDVVVIPSGPTVRDSPFSTT
jgi:hypothetical protein